MLSRSDWLLMFIGAEGGSFPTDQVRVMKGLFLLSQIASHPLHGQYRFEADDSGPFDPMVYRDLDQLQLDGLIRVQWQPGFSRKIYELTEQGQQRFVELTRRVPPSLTHTMDHMKRRVTSQSFESLLAQINAEYPQFAVENAGHVKVVAG